MTEKYAAETLMQSRKDRDEHVRANPRHWLALAGLFMLKEGDNSFGSADANKIVLPGFPHPYSGCLHLEDGQVSLTESAEGVLLNRQPAEPHFLKADVDGDPDLVEAGPIHLMIIRRGGNTMLRAWDVDAQALKEFKGFKYFPVNPDYCFKAKFMPYNPPKTFTVTDVIGSQHESSLLGEVHFNLNGKNLALQIEDADDEGLISFVDETRKDLTYPGGRFLTLPKPLEDTIMLDFNAALNWPCAYTAWATCPLPPKENFLPVRIEAGEMRYHE
ncbi:MAG TPA: DUF1684 domain-containing protein [Anaerolineaceae bacterium]|nr:DUF1684 domain-containing protein [Anaerolineaceae bacterium]